MRTRDVFHCLTVLRASHLLPLMRYFAVHSLPPSNNGGPFRNREWPNLCSLESTRTLATLKRQRKDEEQQQFHIQPPCTYSRLSWLSKAWCPSTRWSAACRAAVHARRAAIRLPRRRARISIAAFRCRLPLGPSPNGIMPAAIWGRISRFKIEVCDLLQGDQAVSCWSKFVAVHESASLIGRFGSSAFRLSITTVSMSVAGQQAVVQHAKLLAKHAPDNE
jgi:hypothetical protein